MRSIFFITALMFFITSTGFAQGESNVKINGVDLSEKQKISQLGILNYRGLQLGMSRTDVKALLEIDRNWSFEFKSGLVGNNIFLKNSDPFGCEKKGQEEDCYYTETIAVEFFNDKIFQITIVSYNSKAFEIDRYLKEWANFVFKAINIKYGKPSQILIPINSINIFTTKNGFSTTLVKWKTRKQSIKLQFTQEEFKFYTSIRFIDDSVISKINSQRKTIESAL